VIAGVRDRSVSRIRAVEEIRDLSRAGQVMVLARIAIVMCW